MRVAAMPGMFRRDAASPHACAVFLQPFPNFHVERVSAGKSWRW